MADWGSLTTIHVLLGFEAEVLGLLRFRYSADDSVEALLIIAFILYVAATALIALDKFAELGNELIVDVVNICLLFIAGLFLIIGVAVAGSNTDAYAGVLEMIGCLCAWLGAAFIVAKLIITGNGVQSRTGPGPS